MWILQRLLHTEFSKCNLLFNIYKLHLRSRQRFFCLPHCKGRESTSPRCWCLQLGIHLSRLYELYQPQINLLARLSFPALPRHHRRWIMRTHAWHMGNEFTHTHPHLEALRLAGRLKWSFSMTGLYRGLKSTCPPLSDGALRSLKFNRLRQSELSKQHRRNSTDSKCAVNSPK